MREVIYRDLDERLRGAAEIQITAHLIKLVEERKAHETGGVYVIPSREDGEESGRWRCRHHRPDSSRSAALGMTTVRIRASCDTKTSSRFTTTPPPK